MNKVRLILTMVVIFILADLSGFFIHSIWLHPDYPLAKIMLGIVTAEVYGKGHRATPGEVESPV